MPTPYSTTAALAALLAATWFSAPSHAQPMHIGGYELPGAASGTAFGWSVAFAGDPDDDQLADFIVGAPGATTNTGNVTLVPGDQSAPTTFDSPNPQVGAFFGWSVAHVGDITGSNGGNDYIVGAPGETAGAPGSGRAYVYSPGAPPQPYASINPELNGLFGFATAGVGDVLGAAYDDIGVGAPGETVDGDSGAGRVYLFGFGGFEVLESFLPRQGGSFGAALAAVGDLTGNGSLNLIVGAPGEGTLNDAGLIHAFGETEWEVANQSPNPSAGGRFGTAIVSLGDLDNDGRREWAVGAPGEFNGDGRVYVYSGYSDLVATLAPEAPEPLNSGGATQFGIALDTADVNEDGITDLLVGAPGMSGAFIHEGRVLVYSGTDMSLIATLAADAPETNGRFGTAIATAQMPRGPLRILAGAPSESGGAGRVHIFSQGSVTSGEPLAWASGRSVLRPPVPNPFGSRATVSFELSAGGPARLALYDALGREVAVVFDGVVPAGAHEASLDAATLPTGVYLLRLSTPGARDLTRRITVVR